MPRRPRRTTRCSTRAPTSPRSPPSSGSCAPRRTPSAPVRVRARSRPCSRAPRFLRRCAGGTPAVRRKSPRATARRTAGHRAHHTEGRGARGRQRPDDQRAAAAKDRQDEQQESRAGTLLLSGRLRARARPPVWMLARAWTCIRGLSGGKRPSFAPSSCRALVNRATHQVCPRPALPHYTFVRASQDGAGRAGGRRGSPTGAFPSALIGTRGGFPTPTWGAH